MSEKVFWNAALLLVILALQSTASEELYGNFTDFKSILLFTLSPQFSEDRNLIALNKTVW